MLRSIIKNTTSSRNVSIADHAINTIWKHAQQQSTAAVPCHYLLRYRFLSTAVSTNNNDNNDEPQVTINATASTASINKASNNNSSSSSSSSSSNSNDNDTIPNCSKPLGSPLPFDEHACSVSLPTWSSVVGYEEGDAAVTGSMQCGYPRFVYHPYVLQLMQICIQQNADFATSSSSPIDCLVLPTKQAALRCQVFLQQAVEKKFHPSLDNAMLETPEVASSILNNTNNNNSDQSKIKLVSLMEQEDHPSNVYAVLFPAETLAGTEAKAYWQHTGEIVSSRRAELALNALQIPISKRVTCPITPTIYHECTKHDKNAQECPFTKLKSQIQSWTNVDSTDHIFLTPSGMSTIYTALRSSRRYQLSKRQEAAAATTATTTSTNAPGAGGGTSIVFGFPYLDTLKLCSRTEFCPDGVEFYGKGDAFEIEKLEQSLKAGKNKKRWSALFTEVPSNPLLQCPDLYKLRQLADEYDFMLIVDDTIGNFLNLDLLHTGIADAICTSLTKLVSGRGDVMAGSVVTNPNTEKGRWLQQDLMKYHNNQALHPADAFAMYENSLDFVERNSKINETSEQLADWLNTHPDIEMVWYPKFCSPELYQKVVSTTKKGSGYGGLLSIHLHSHMCQRTFYDELNIAKGPSLGTNFTLACPYTLLAHYHELDFAMSYNVSPNLLRIAVGLEDFDSLQEKFKIAFEKSRLFPKLK